jgi:2-polyprenyl-6-methoxyphenol hydroxylase-like FAD-dependent oxidoreductase
MTRAPVLIVGAGPTGLVLALWLAKRGIPHRIIDRHSGPGLQSRAMVVQARTLEFYRQLRFSEEVVSAGIIANTIHLKQGSREVAQLPFGDFGKGLSPYPFALSFPQDDHEKLLGSKLGGLGTQVEWNTELVELNQDAGSVHAALETPRGKEELDTPFLCGCDGARSTVRESLGFGFPGGTYQSVFFVADVDAPKEIVDENGFNLCLNDDAFILVFPIRSSGSFRLIGLLPENLRNRPDVTYEDIREFVEHSIDVQTRGVHWFSTYRVHHRVADRFRLGRVFLAGDAGHIHSPAGGQGMNTGIGDAVNLAWKIAEAWGGNPQPDILDSYETERIAFARGLIDSTDRAFKLIVGQDWGSHLARELIPHFAPMVLGFTAIRRAAFKVVSQVRIQYHDSMLSEGQVGELQGGDRLPWVEDQDNFAPLQSLDWQIHAYGPASADLDATAKRFGISLVELAETEDSREAGFEPDAFYLVRPDGYISLAASQKDPTALSDFWTQHVRI